MYYYVFRKNVNDASIKNCEKFTDLEEAKAGAQDEEYYEAMLTARLKEILGELYSQHQRKNGKI